MKAKENAAGQRAVTWIMLAVVLTAGLAGCIGSEDEAGDGDTAEPTASGSAEAQAAAGQTSTAPGTGGNASANVTLVEETRRIVWNSSKSERVVVCEFVSGQVCTGQEDLTGQDEPVLRLGQAAQPVRAEFTLTWDSANADVHGMFFGLYTTYCCTDYIAFDQGGGPELSFSIDEIELDEDDDFGIYVQQAGQGLCAAGTCAAYVLAGGPVDFTVEGTYTVLVPAGEG